jgi:cysteinyl-tRNA synthetase
MKKRELARTSQEWEAADRLRDELVAMGVELHDKKVR